MLTIRRSAGRATCLALLVAASTLACDAVLGIRVYPADAGTLEAAGPSHDSGNDALIRRDANTRPPEDAQVCRTVCGDAGCVDLQTDPTHCGTCSTDCTRAVNVSSVMCSAGQCTYTCASGYASNDTCPGGADAAGCPVSLASPTHCGSCDAQCAESAPNCTPAEGGGAASCTLMCGGSLTNCGGSCVDLQTSSSHCGTCLHPCASFGCSGGTCAVCMPGTTQCSGNGIATCGPNGQWGSVVACAGGQSCCTPLGGTPSCVLEQTDSNNCGGCGISCGGLPCNAGVCCATGTQPIAYEYCSTGGEISDSWFGDSLQNRVSCGSPSTNADAFQVVASPTPAQMSQMATLYRCQYTDSGGATRYFLGTACAGTLGSVTVTSDGPIGYLYTSQVCGTQPLYRYYNATYQNRWSTLSAATPAGYGSQSITGYAW